MAMGIAIGAGLPSVLAQDEGIAADPAAHVVPVCGEWSLTFTVEGEQPVNAKALAKAIAKETRLQKKGVDTGAGIGSGSGPQTVPNTRAGSGTMTCSHWLSQQEQFVVRRQAEPG
jgi:hypothetical protein